MKALGAGSEIDAWCTKCRMDKLHRIVAMHEGRPKRVVCLSCDGQHNYRQPKGQEAEKKARAKSTASPKTSKKAAERGAAEAARVNEWESKIAGQPTEAFTRYAIDKTFAQDQLVYHKKFGEGFVVEIHDAGKVSVMFRDGPKVLAQGMAV